MWKQSWKVYWFWWLKRGFKFLIFFFLMGLLGYNRLCRSQSIKHSCYLTDVQPYHFPLDRPITPQKPPVHPDHLLRVHRPFMRGITLGLYFKKCLL